MRDSPHYRIRLIIEDSGVFADPDLSADGEGGLIVYDDIQTYHEALLMRSKIITSLLAEDS